jgi:dihydropyrimidinase
MPRAETAVVNGLVVSSQGLTARDVYIAGEKITALAPRGGGPSADTVIDAAGKLILPGIIDVHLHPVYIDRIETLSAAAACEGVTTLIPYVGAVTSWGWSGGLLAAADAFLAEAARDSVVDFSLHGVVLRGDMPRVGRLIPELMERGIHSFKIFMAYPKRGMMLADAEILEVMELVQAHGGVLATHAENGAVVDYMEDRCRALGKERPEHYPPSHPNQCEAEAVFRVLSMAGISGCPIYLPHITTAESLAVIRLFKQWQTVEFYSETCTHYLVLDQSEMKRRGSLVKMAPPLRRRADVDALWSAVDAGLIDVIASDTAGSSLEKNQPLWDKIFDAPYGVPGVETLLAMIYQEGVNRGRLTLPRLVETLCENPARIFGLYPRKGVLAPGSDADLVIFDPAREAIIPAGHPQLNIEYGLYEGRCCLGKAGLVMQRGAIISREGQLAGCRGQGRFVPASSG